MRTDVLIDVPWRKVFQAYFKAREVLYTKEPPDQPGVSVDHTPLEMSVKFAKRTYNTRWMFSYNYRGEDLNVRIEYYDSSFKWPFRQFHVRGFWIGGRTFLMPHEEVSPDGDNRLIPDDQATHQKAHLKGREYSHERGYDILIREMDDMVEEYKEHDSMSDLVGGRDEQ